MHFWGFFFNEKWNLLSSRIRQKSLGHKYLKTKRPNVIIYLVMYIQIDGVPRTVHFEQTKSLLGNQVKRSAGVSKLKP